MKYFRYSALLAAVLLLAACGQMAQPEANSAEGDVIVITEGVPAPAANQAPTLNPLSTLENAVVSLGGSSTTPLSVNGDDCTTFPAQQVVISYTLSGNQVSPASFDVYTKWDFNGTSFVGSNPTTVHLPAKSGGGSVQYQVTINVENSSETGSGTTSFVVAPFNLVTNMNDSPGQRLSFGANSSATVHVAFATCTSANTAPSLTIPADITREATSSSGAVVTFSVSAADAEDGDLTNSVICTPASGSTFPIGETTVNCSVTDSGGLSAQGSFKVYVQDTTSPIISGAPTGPVTLIATDINGATYDLSGITAYDLVDGIVPVSCSNATFPIGGGGTVTCTASDTASYRAPGSESIPTPNTATIQFYVSVTLDLSGVNGFLSPLRMSSPFSAHKRGSTIPHKFPAPKYADGTLATDLAGGLNLTLAHQGTAGAGDVTTVDDPATGSTVWRYDDGHYIFNAKSANNWAPGNWTTTVKYAGITLAESTFELRR